MLSRESVHILPIRVIIFCDYFFKAQRKLNITQSIFAFRDDDSIETKVQRINYPRMATIAQTEETHEYFDKFIQMGNNIFDAFEKANPFNLMEFLMKNVINAIRDLSTPRNVAMSNFTKWTIAHSLGMVNYFFFQKTLGL